MTFGGSSDRDIIRARRALFIAAALSTLSGTTRAELPKKPECKREEPVSAEREEEAKSFAREGIQLSQQGLHDEALFRFQRAFELLPHPKVALLAAKESQVLGAPNDAIIWLNAALECGLDGDDRSEAERLIESTKAASGEIELRFQTLDPGNETYIDGAEVDPNGKTLVETASLDEKVIDPNGKIYVTPGKHVLDIQDNHYRHVIIQFEIAAGESRIIDINLEAAVLPRVCLSPLPCLQPPPPPPDPRERARLILDVGALGLIDLTRDEYQNHGLGGALGLGLSIPLSRRGLRTFIGLEAGPSKLRSGMFLPLGVRLEAAIPMGRMASIGFGVQGGWVVVSGDDSTDDTFRPRSSAFVEPYLPVDAWFGDHVGIQLRPGLVFSQQKSVSDEAFRLGFYRVGVFFRYAFGSSDDEYEVQAGARKSPLASAARMSNHGW